MIASRYLLSVDPVVLVIPGREQSERTRNLEIPGLVLRTIPE
jgi:hypothetical protein